MDTLFCCRLLLILALTIGAAHAAESPAGGYDALIQQGKSQLQAGNAERAAASGKAAIKMSTERWEGYALAGGALMNLKRYEEAADALSKAIELAPESKQSALRDLRRQCLASEAGTPTVTNGPPPAAMTSQAEIVLWKSIENSTNLKDFQSYLDQYPQGAFAVIARRHLEEARNTTKAHINAVIAEAEESQISIPGGSFQMGSITKESKNAAMNEGPVHTVSVPAFSLSKYLVTRGEFAVFVEDTAYQINDDCNGTEFILGKGVFPHHDESWRRPGFMQTDREPVVCVSWNDARAYADWLSRKTGHRYRLPTEAEFEYAARTNVVGARYWGDHPKQACEYANVPDESSQPQLQPCNDNAPNTSPVGSYKPNPLGLYDMMGNVWELTQDCYHDSYIGAPVDGSAWVEDDCRTRSTRGGSFQAPVNPWLTIRHALFPTARANAFGFRLARDL